MACTKDAVRHDRCEVETMKDARHIVLTAAGILAAAGLVFGALVVVNAETGFVGCTVTSRFGWMAPLLAGSVIGGAAWALLGQHRAGEEERAGRDAAPCGACGREVLGQWRMCPYCGAMLDRSPRRHAVPEDIGDR
jgi:hypothetical protein